MIVKAGSADAHFFYQLRYRYAILGNQTLQQLPTMSIFFTAFQHSKEINNSVHLIEQIEVKTGQICAIKVYATPLPLFLKFLLIWQNKNEALYCPGHSGKKQKPEWWLHQTLW